MLSVHEVSGADLLYALNEALDELSTRLMIGGRTSLCMGDFERLATLAAAAGELAFESAAIQLGESLATSEKSASCGVVTEGLHQLRSLLDRRQDKSASPSGTEPSEAGGTPCALAAEDEMVREFITESMEHLSHIEGQMLLLEKDNRAVDTLNAVFRAFHTIKGLAGFLQFPSIQSFAHEVETLLDLARNLKLEVTPLVVDLLLESTDALRGELAGIELRLAGRPAPPSSLTGALRQRIRGAASAEPPAIEGLAPIPQLAPQIVLSRQQRKSTSTGPAAQPVTHLPPPAASKPVEAASIRIDTVKLDQLMDMVGEMVIAQTLIAHSPALNSINDARLLNNLNQLGRITADVQRMTTGMRMIPIGAQFQKTGRLIRDLSRRAGKQIVLETAGEETELDKTIAEELADPLLHMVRNSIDHGIEPPAERVALGKSPTAKLRLSAQHEGGLIVISISDDGRGLNREKILAKALQNGLIQPGAHLQDQEIVLLIFEPGFSTADKLSDISGRGVGMDVVREHVRKLRGRIEIESSPGKGTTFFLKLPLTLAIIEGLVVLVGGHRYIVPLFSVKEIFRPKQDMLSTVQQTGEMVLVRDGLMPIIRLHSRFSIPPASTNLTEGILIVAESQGRQFCLFVDGLLGKQEVVIKSLGEAFKQVQGIAGCAILGDGRVGLILDVDGIYRGRA